MMFCSRRWEFARNGYTGELGQASLRRSSGRAADPPRQAKQSSRGKGGAKNCGQLNDEEGKTYVKKTKTRDLGFFGW